MKVVVLSTYERSGGAAVAASRTVEALRADGHQVHYLVQHAAGIIPETEVVGGKVGRMLSSMRSYLDRVPTILAHRRAGPLFSSAILPNRSLKEIIARLDPDIINVHWVNGGFLRLPLLSSLAKPVVWTLHDSWAFTGGCHIPGNCSRYEDKCGRCPVLFSNSEWDLSRWNWYRKKVAYRNFPQAIAVPSHWMAAAVQRSSLMGNKPVYVIPNPIDTAKFSAIDRKTARNALRLPLEKKLVLFSAMSAVTDKNKGFDLLEKALLLLPTSIKKQSALVVAGSANIPELDSMPTYALGTLHDEIALRLLYSAVDILVVPSRSESFSLVTQEAMSCGVPVVAFAVGGIGDLITSGENGILAEPENPKSLAEGLVSVLSDEGSMARYAQNARSTVVSRYSYEKCAKQYDAAFRQAMERYERMKES